MRRQGHWMAEKGNLGNPLEDLEKQTEADHEMIHTLAKSLRDAISWVFPQK